MRLWEASKWRGAGSVGTFESWGLRMGCCLRNINLSRRNLALLLVVSTSLVPACSSQSRQPTQTASLPSSISPLATVTVPSDASEPEETPNQPTPASVAMPTRSPPPPELLATQAPELAVVAIVTSISYPSPWMTYIDKDHGFQIDFPDGFEIGMSTLPYLSDSNLLVSFRFPESPQYASYEFNNDVVVAYVEVRAYPPDELDQAEFARATTVIVGGNAFRHIKAGDNSMGGRYGIYDYYYIEQGDLIFRIGLTLYGDGPGAGANNGMGPLPEDFAPPGAKGSFNFVLELMVASLEFQS